MSARMIPTDAIPPRLREDVAVAAPPRVTVVIPTFNWSTVLPFSIGTALGQTVRDIEVLVVGDGCTDGSEATVRAIDDPRVQWINLPRNSGHQSAPNNEGLRQARGDLIAYLGHDDLWLPHHLALGVEALAGEAALSYGITAAVRPNGTVQFMPPRFDYRPGACPPPSSIVHRRAMTEAIGGWRPAAELREAPDPDLWRRAHAAGYRFAFVPRLSAIKFPAQWRRDAYRIRACDEQADWFRRIREEPNLEAIVLGRLVESAGGASALRLLRYSDLLREVVSEAVERVRIRLSDQSPAVFFGAGKGARLDAYRRFKGLPPADTRVHDEADAPKESGKEKDPC